MLRNRLVTLSVTVLAATVLAGCDDGGDDTASDAAPTTPAASSAAPAPSLEPSVPAGLDEATKTACANLDKDIKAAQKQIAEAEKIGPPAGHLAVSAQYSAGAAKLYVHMIGIDGTVNTAAEKVTTAMTGLADEYMKDPKKKPSKAPLTEAVKELTTACAAG